VFICQNSEEVHPYLLKCCGVHAHLSECWRGTLLEKGWEPLD